MTDKTDTTFTRADYDFLTDRLSRTFGDEFAKLGNAHKAFVIADATRVKSFTDYASAIGAGNLRSYARTIATLPDHGHVSPTFLSDLILVGIVSTFIAEERFND